ncbi:MAG TPA: AI-2E family transporter [Edaphocola sp.]|nr:AI-2E family transporter [Edaphocola sp.]
MSNKIDNNIIKQVVILLLIVLLGVIIVWQLAYFIPGFLGAMAIYILFRSWNLKLQFHKKWKPALAALTIVLGLLIAIVLPLFFIGQLLNSKLQEVMLNSDQIKNAILEIYNFLKIKFPTISINQEHFMLIAQKGVGLLPSIINGTAKLFANTFTALFIAYFLFVSGKKMEQVITANLPLAKTNRNELWIETKNLVVSNTIGIPVLAVGQGFLAGIGYWICGVPSVFLWALLTGVSSVIPVIGTMAVWIPIVVYLFAIGNIGFGIGLGIYCLIVVGLSDNIIRFAFLKKFGDIHPLITVFGVIIGLNIFGVIGLIFGPLILSYFILLLKIYKFEFSKE